MIKLAYKYWNIKVMHQKNWKIVSFIKHKLEAAMRLPCTIDLL